MAKNKNNLGKLEKRILEIMKEITTNSSQLIASVAGYMESYDVKTLPGKITRAGMNIMDTISDLEFEIRDIKNPHK